MNEWMEALIVGAGNGLQIALRTKQVILIGERRVWALAWNGWAIAAVYLISTYLGLKALERGGWLVVAAYILSNGVAAAVTTWRQKRLERLPS